MTAAQLLRYRFPAMGMVGLALVGCQMPIQSAGSKANTTTRGQRFVARRAVATPGDVSCLGSHPAGRDVPNENRLLANMMQHTFSSIGRDFDPDISPDGQVMVFASTRNSEHPDIFMKNVSGYAITQLSSDPADDIQPRFSPDGSRVAFCSNRSGNWDVWMVNRDGTALTQLTHDRSDEVAPCWSPDGKQLAFTVWGRRSRQWEIWTLSVERPGIRRFLCYGMFPDWSPDGGRIAFQRARQRGTRWFSVWVVDLVGDEARHPTELAHSDSMACIAPRWSPDGRIIVYCAVRRAVNQANSASSVAADVWLVDAESGERLKLTDGAVDAFNPTWSNGGRVFFVSARSGVENIWSLRTAGDYCAGQPDEKPRASRTTANAPAGVKGK